MTNAKPANPGGPLEILITEIERWNRQINLVSRVRTRHRVSALVAQCRAGWDLVAEALGGEEWFSSATYIDIGSGAGLPGLVWTAERSVMNHGGAAMLVEPRDKRAWFLRRTARLMGFENLSVEQCRWGEGGGSINGRAAIVSLKALRLDDGVILDGFENLEAAGLMDVAIVRFLDPEQHSREWLEEAFALDGGVDGAVWSRTEIASLGEGDPRLLLTRYHRV